MSEAKTQTSDVFWADQEQVVRQFYDCQVLEQLGHLDGFRPTRRNNKPMGKNNIAQTMTQPGNPPLIAIVPQRAQLKLPGEVIALLCKLEFSVS